MMLQGMASLFIRLASALLRIYLQQRQTAIDAEAKARLTLAVEQLEGVTRALQFKVAAARDPVGAGELRVRPSAGPVPLPGDAPRADGPAD